MAQNQTLVTKSPTNPYGNSPASLASPVPSVGPVDDLEAEIAAAAEADLSSLGAQSGQARMPAAAPAMAEVDPFEAELAAALGEAPAAAAPAVQTPAPMQGQDADLLTRFRASFAGNDQEKLSFLQQQFGPQNARMGGDGELEYSKDGKKFQKFDSKLFGNFLDMFVPSGREALKEVALLGPEVAGGFMGGALAAPTVVGAPAGAVGGAAASRVAFTPAVNRLADSVAEFMGIPQDPTRDKERENLMEQSIEAMLPGVAVIGKNLVRGVAKKIPGTALNKEVKQAARAADVYEIDSQGKEVLSALDQLKEAGLSAELLNSQINTRSKPLQDAVSLVKDTKEIQSAVVRIAQGAKENIEQTFRALSDNKIAARASDGRIGELVSGGAQALRAAEGAEIGRFKAKAMANTKNAKLPVPPEVMNTVRNLTMNLGFTPDGKPPKDMKALVGKFGLTSTGEVRSFVNALGELTNVGRDGTLRYSDLDTAIKTVGNLVEKAKGTKSELSGVWPKLASDLRTFKNQAIENGLQDESEKLAFRATNARYGSLLENVANIEKLVTDDMGSHVVVDQLLGKGKEALGNAKALKEILPAPTWEKLKGDWAEKQLLDFRNTKTGDYNAAGLSDYFNKTLGPEFMDLMFDGNKKKFNDLKAALVIGQRVADTPLSVSGKARQDELEAASKGAVQSIMGSAFLAGNAMLNTVFKSRKKGKESEAITALLGDEGFRRYISGLPPSKRGIVTQKVDEMYDYAVKHNLMPAAKSIDTAKGIVRGTGDYANRSMRQDVRTYLGETGETPQYQTPMEDE